MVTIRTLSAILKLSYITAAFYLTYMGRVELGLICLVLFKLTVVEDKVEGNG